MSQQSWVRQVNRRAPTRRAGTIGAGLGLCLVVAAGGSVRLSGTVTGADPVQPAGPAIVLPIALARGELSGSPTLFGPYAPVPVTVVPNAPDYIPNLSQLVNQRLLERLSPDQQLALAQNGFVVVPAAHKQFHHLYSAGRSAGIPPFVTTDALLHTYHALYSLALRGAEQAALMADLDRLTATMLGKAAAAAPGGPVGEAARQRLAFFAVADRLIHPEHDGPAAVRDVVAAELALIDAHGGVAESPLFGYDEDYGQYLPRGHYARDEASRRYFRAMMWYGRIGFRLAPMLSAPVRRRETRAALLTVSALHEATVGRESALQVWDRIYDVTAFFVGTADDLTVHDYANLARRIYGRLPTPTDLADDATLDAFVVAARDLRPPAILGSPIRPGQDKTMATMGFRFMGQRYIPDSAMFQRLVHDEVKGTYRGPGSPFTMYGGVRAFPRGLDVPAALGSARALDILIAGGDTEYDGYGEQLGALRVELQVLGPDRWTSNLYWSWLYSLGPLLEVPGRGFPFFMRNRAWVDKSLNTWLGSWSQLRHDTILYAKPSTGVPVSRPPDPDGYVEPNPWLYARLAALSAQMRAGLAARGLLDTGLATRLDQMEALLIDLKDISERELIGVEPTTAQSRLIREIAGPLWELVQVDPAGTPDETGEQIAVVADVHSAPDAGLALEEGVGDAFEIYVVLPRPGGQTDEQVLMRGGTFAYYEFKWPLADRLTDERWQAMDPKPPLPDWTPSFLITR